MEHSNSSLSPLGRPGKPWPHRGDKPIRGRVHRRNLEKRHAIGEVGGEGSGWNFQRKESFLQGGGSVNASSRRQSPGRG